jgi:hypothetical protein
MIDNRKRFLKSINNIEFKMLRINRKCWIKIEPSFRVSIHSTIHFKMNNESYEWDVFNKDGIESHEIFFEGYDCNPSFYLISDNNYRIDFKDNDIKIVLIKNKHNLKEYIEKYCNCNSKQSYCWAKSLYHTSRPDKPPFDEM